MLQAQRSRGVRLGVDFEANSLIASMGAEAYSVACLRAQEASSDEIAQDWTDVAGVIAHRMRRRSGFLSSMLLH
jgi:hypothetical protein